MKVKISKWGNSLALRLPKSITDGIELQEGSEMDLSLIDEKIIATPIRKRKYNLKELLAQITNENIHPETDFGKPVGKEIW